jgi:hypothetical protein
MGSGYLLKTKMKAHPDHDWHKEVLRLLDTEEEAFTYEANVIGDLWQTDPLCLNLKEGGEGAGSETMKERWQDPEFRQMVLDARADPEVRQRVSEAAQSRWQDPEFREKMSAIRRETWADPERRERLSELKKEQCDNDEFKSIKRKQIKGQWADPEFQARVSEARAEQWADPAYRKLRTAQTKAQYADATIRVKRDGVICEVNKDALEQAIDDGWMLDHKVYLQHDTHEVYVSLMSAPTIKQLLQAGWVIGMCAAYRKVKVSEAKALT